MILVISNAGDQVRGTAYAGVHNKYDIDNVWDDWNQYGIQFNFFQARDIHIHPGCLLKIIHV